MRGGLWAGGCDTVRRAAAASLHSLPGPSLELGSMGCPFHMQRQQQTADNSQGSSPEATRGSGLVKPPRPRYPKFWVF